MEFVIVLDVKIDGLSLISLFQFFYRVLLVCLCLVVLFPVLFSYLFFKQCAIKLRLMRQS